MKMCMFVFKIMIYVDFSIPPYIFSAVTDRRSIIFLPSFIHNTVSELKNNVQCFFMMTLTFIMILQNNKNIQFQFGTIC